MAFEKRQEEIAGYSDCIPFSDARMLSRAPGSSGADIKINICAVRIRATKGCPELFSESVARSKKIRNNVETRGRLAKKSLVVEEEPVESWNKAYLSAKTPISCRILRAVTE